MKSSFLQNSHVMVPEIGTGDLFNRYKLISMNNHKLRLIHAGICFLLICISLPSLAAERNADRAPFKIEIIKLDNGLTVILNEDHSKPEIMGGVVVKAGGKHDPADHTGIAHYLEHMLFKGTSQLGTINWEEEKAYQEKIYTLYEELGASNDAEKREEIQKQINEYSLKAGEYAVLNEMDNLLRSIGSTGINAFTSEEITFYFNTFPAHQFARWAEIYSHRFQDPVFRAFQAELEVVYEEKNMYQDNFAMSLFETFNASFYKKHPYGQQTILGSVEHLRNPSLNSMYAFYNTWYVANNMALILVGNFSKEEIMPLVVEKFGSWRSGELPEYPRYEESPFAGRELVKKRMSPVKIGLLGFRTVPNNHPDEWPLMLANRILSNSGQTGLLDQLTIDNKLMMAGHLDFPNYNDYGQSIFLYIPKVIGQSHNKAEKLVLEQLHKLHRGEFSDELLDAAKNNIYLEYYTSMEDFSNRAVLLAQAFTQNRDLHRYLSYPEKLNQLTRDEVIRVARQYYGDNYLAFQSGMGFPKKVKLDKPGYDPIQPAKDTLSLFAKRFQDIPEGEPQLSFVDFERDMHVEILTPGATLYKVSNPQNKIFSLTLKYGVGKHLLPRLDYAASLMDFAGTPDKSTKEVKRLFQLYGCEYRFSATDSYLYVELKGKEEYFDKSLALLFELLQQPVVEKRYIKNLHEMAKGERKFENADPSAVGGALLEYIRRGEQSSYLARPSLKEIARMKPEDLLVIFHEALGYEMEAHLVISEDTHLDLKNALLPFSGFHPELKASQSPVVIPDRTFENDQVFFVHKKDAVQSYIYFYLPAGTYTIEKEALIDAFNEYFGGGFSGIVVQEIREYRSMAYAAGARLSMPARGEQPGLLVGFIGTQSDKTIEAIEVFLSLVRDLPLYPERMDNLRNSLVQETLSQRPDFRSTSQVVRNWQYRGWSHDPARSKTEVFQTLQMEDLDNFFKANIAGRNIVIAVTGDRSGIDLQKLQQFGVFHEIPEKSLYLK